MSLIELNTIPKISKLSNGLRVATMKISGDFSAVGYWVKSGSLYETAENNGVSHYLEHIIFKGTDRFSEQQLTDFADRKGINLMASTSRSTTNFYSQVPNESMALATEIVSDMIFNPKMLDSSVENERETILMEDYEVSHDLNEVLWDAIHRVTFPNTSAGRPILGSHDNIKTMTTKQIRDHHKNFFDRDNMYFIAATEMPHEKVCEMVEKATAFLKPQPEKPPGSLLPSDNSFWTQKFEPSENHLACNVFKDTALVGMALPAAPLCTRDYTLALIFKSVVSERNFCRFTSSPLFRNPAITSAHSQLIPYANTSILSFYGQTKDNTYVDWCFDIIKNLRNVFEDKTVAETAKLNAKFSFAFQMVSPKVVADETGMNLLLRGRMKPLQEWFDEIDSITDDELAQFYDKYFSNVVPSIVVIGPPPSNQNQQQNQSK